MKDRVRELIIDGKTTKEIAGVTNRSMQQIQKIIKDNGWRDLPKGKTAIAVRMLQDGVSVTTVVIVTGLSRPQVYKIKKKYVPRPKKRSNARQASKHPMSKWSESQFLRLSEMANSYYKQFVAGGIYCRLEEIEGELLDVIIDVDCIVGVENKTSYLAKAVSKRMKVLQKELCDNELIFETLFENDAEDSDIINGEESNGHCVTPEMLYFLRKKVSKSRVDK